MARTFYSRPPGESFIDIAMLGDYVRGITVDNPSGSWLRLVTTNDYIPPYTLGWARPLPVAATSVSLIAGNGPSGQLGTTQGDNVEVWLENAPVIASDGSSTTIVSRQQEPELLSIEYDIIVDNALPVTMVTTLVGPTQRLRLHQMQVWYPATFNLGPPLNGDRPYCQSICRVFSSPTLLRLGTMQIDANRLRDNLPYPRALDLPLGDEIAAQIITPDWSVGNDFYVSFGIIYSIL